MHRTLTLKTSDIHVHDTANPPTSITDEYQTSAGVIRRFLTDVTFHVNLRVLLGDQWGMHDYWHLDLLSFATIPNTVSDPALGLHKPLDNVMQLEYRALNIWLSELPMHESSYTVIPNCHTRHAHLGTLLDQYRLMVGNLNPLNTPGNFRVDEMLAQADEPRRGILMRADVEHVQFRFTFGTAFDLTKTTIPSSAFPSGEINCFPQWIVRLALSPA